MATTAISKAEKNALSVSYDAMGTHVELDMNFVKHYLVRGQADKVTDQEVLFFMNTCMAQKLNPLVAGEAYCIKFGNDPAQMVVGKGAYLRRAFEHPDYLCKEDGIIVIRNGEAIQKEGCCLYPGEQLLGGWCRVHFMRNGKERSCYKEVAFSEYDKGQANWKSKPATMVNKVAISQCVREAFPKDYEGLYTIDEMQASGAIPENYQVIEDTGEVVEVEVEENPKISQEQRQQMFSAIREIYSDSKEANAKLKELVLAEGYTSTSDLTLSTFKKIMSEIDALKSGSSEVEEPDEFDEEVPEPDEV